MRRARYAMAALLAALVALVPVVGSADELGVVASDGAAVVQPVLAEPAVGPDDGVEQLASADDVVYISGTLDFDAAKEQMELTNQERSAVGVGALHMDPRLQEAAMLRAAECAVNFSHTRPDGSSCFTAVSHVASYAFAENIAAGSSTAAAATDQWMNSSGHRANMLSSRYTSMGVGCVRVGAVAYWVQIFAQTSESGYAGVGAVPGVAEIAVSYGTVPFNDSTVGFNLNMWQEDPEPVDAGATYGLQVGVHNPGWSAVYAPCDQGGFTWTSSDESAFVVDDAGLVRAVGEVGSSATITATSPGGYSISKRFVVTAGVPTYSVTFVTNGGTAVDGQTVFEGDAAQRPADPTRAYYRFTGWYTDVSLRNRYDFSAAVTGDVTLYAGWTGYSPYAGFTDVISSDWYVTCGLFDYTLDHGFMNGYSGTTRFGPYDAIRRGQVMCVLWNMAGNPEAGAVSDFDDVGDPDAYYYNAVRWARSVGVANGYGGTNEFRPNAYVSRQELAAFLCNYAREVEKIDTSSDHHKASGIAGWSDVADWARPSMAWVIDEGIMNGSQTEYGPDLKPLDEAWRASMATMAATFHRDVING